MGQFLILKTAVPEGHPEIGAVARPGGAYIHAIFLEPLKPPHIEPRAVDGVLLLMEHQIVVGPVLEQQHQLCRAVPVDILYRQAVQGQCLRQFFAVRNISAPELIADRRHAGVKGLPVVIRVTVIGSGHPAEGLHSPQNREIGREGLIIRLRHGSF